VTDRFWDATSASVFWRISSSVSPPLPPEAASGLFAESDPKI
jgi:hypothetical protein